MKLRNVRPRKKLPQLTHKIKKVRAVCGSKSDTIDLGNWFKNPHSWESGSPKFPVISTKHANAKTRTYTMNVIMTHAFQRISPLSTIM